MEACGAARVGRSVCLQRVAELTVVEATVPVLVKLQELGPHVGRAGGPLPLAQLTHHRVELVEIEQPVAVRVVPLEQVRCMRGRGVEGQRLERIAQLAVVEPAAAVAVVPHECVTNIGGHPMGHSPAARCQGSVECHNVELTETCTCEVGERSAARNTTRELKSLTRCGSGV